MISRDRVCSKVKVKRVMEESSKKRVRTSRKSKTISGKSNSGQEGSTFLGKQNGRLADILVWENDLNAYLNCVSWPDSRRLMDRFTSN